jgi:hypothetical protein
LLQPFLALDHERQCARNNRSAGRGHVDDAQSPVALIHNLRD